MSPSDADDGGTAADEPRAPDDLADPTLVADADEAAAIERDDADGEPNAEPERAPTPPSEELKSEGTDEDRPAAVASPDVPGEPAPSEEEAAADATGTAGDPPAAGGSAAAPDPVVPDQPADATTPVSPEPLATAPDDVPTADTDAVAPAVEAASDEAPEPEPEPEPEPDEEPTDERRQALVATLREELGDDVVRVSADDDDLWVRVRLDSWVRAGEVCRDRLGMRYFGYLSALDWLPVPVADAEGATGSGQAALGPIVTGRAGGDTRFQLMARVYSPEHHVGLHLKCDLDDDQPSAPTWVGVYAGADWHEREIHEMYGVDFIGHPHLVHIYLPGAFEGHPMRKDFPLLAREVKPWPGIVDVEPMPGEPEGDAEGGDAA